MFWEQIGILAASVTAFHFVGKAIDVYIGKPGQERIYNKLENYWIIFDDIGPRNIGAREALFASSIFRQFFSMDKGLPLITLILFSLSAPLYLFVINVSFSDRYPSFGQLQLAYVYGFMAWAMFYASVALMYFFAKASATVLGKNVFLNLLYFLILFAFQMAMINVGYFLVSVIYFTLIEVILGISFYIRHGEEFKFNDLSIKLINTFKEWLPYLTNLRSYYVLPELDLKSDVFRNNPMWYYHQLTGIFLNICRLLVVVFFLTMVLIRPLHRVVSVYWLRLTQERVPFYAFLFASIAAVLNFIAQLPRLFSWLPSAG